MMMFYPTCHAQYLDDTGRCSSNDGDYSCAVEGDRCFVIHLMFIDYALTV